MINNKFGMLVHTELEGLESLRDIDKLDKSKPLMVTVECDGYSSTFRPLDVVEIDLNAKPKTGDYVVIGYQDVSITKDNEMGLYERNLCVHTTIGKYEYIGLKDLNKYHVYNLDPDTNEPRLITNIDIAEHKIIGVVVGHYIPNNELNRNSCYKVEQTTLRAWNN